jgi:hypothetical protein
MNSFPNRFAKMKALTELPAQRTECDRIELHESNNNISAGRTLRRRFEKQAIVLIPFAKNAV